MNLRPVTTSSPLPVAGGQVASVQPGAQTSLRCYHDNCGSGWASGAVGERAARELTFKILCLQFDRCTVRRALGRVFPGVSVARQHGTVGHAFGSDEALERVEPVPVVGLAGVEIACS